MSSPPPTSKIRALFRTPLAQKLAFVLRGVGLAVGLFVLTNQVGNLIRPPFDTMKAWLGGPQRPDSYGIVELFIAITLVWHAVAQIRPLWARFSGATFLGLGALLALLDVRSFYKALSAGAIHGPAILPASLLVTLLLTTFALSVLFEKDERSSWTRWRVIACGSVTLASLAAMPLLLMVTFGPTRYERRADCAVVFGARVWDDGTPSQALADRVDEGIRLYQKGFAGALVMSGAIDEHNGFSEPEVMKARAVEAGVPAEAVLIDEAGIDTASTVRNMAKLMRGHAFRTALAVTHYYHEPRVKMLFERAGVTSYTVPAKMSRRLLKEPYFIAREVLAYWHSFFVE